MKYLILIIPILTINVLIAQVDSTQSNDEFKTLFSKKGGKPKVSGFGSVNLDFGKIENKFGLMIGGEGAVLFNRKFYVGLYGRALTTLPKYEFDNSFNNILNIERRGMIGHGGLVLGVNFNPTKPIHFGLSARVGGGAVGFVYYYENYYNNPDLYFPESRHEAIFAFAPEVFVEMNLANWFKVKFGAAYQYISDASVKAPIIKDGELLVDSNGSLVTEEIFTTKNYRTPTLSLGFVFGWFK